MKLGVWLLSLLQPGLARILTSLGFSVVSVVGMDAMLSQLKSAFVQQLTGLPPSWVNIFQLAGGGVAMGIFFGAITTKLILWKVSSAVRILGTNPQ